MLAEIIKILNINNFSYNLTLENFVLSINLLFDSKLFYMKKVLKFSVISVLVLMLIGLILVGGLFIYISTAKSNVDFDKTMLMAQNTTIDIYDIDNNKINDKTGKKALVKFDELPYYVPASFISIEDKGFYKHHGLNYKRIVKALFNNLKTKSLSEGASTISQQLIKNTHLSSEKTFARKINEMALAKELERNFSKDEIMETYLNVIYFGNGAYGLENASQIYFGKTASELNVEETALLAGMIKSPKKYSPLLNPQNALDRRNLVLREMNKDGYISNEIYELAKEKPIKLQTNIANSKSKNFYEEATLQEAENILNMTENEIALSGYKIFTYQVNTDQNALSGTIKDTDYYAQNSYGNIADGAGIVIDNKTGGITAFDGKSIYDIINMKRSPGSAIKPVLVYAPALETGKISPSTMILDEKKSFGNYSPQNVSGIYYGWIDATKSVEKSLNIPAIKIMESTGINASKKMAEKCGIKFDKTDTSLAIALGGMTKGTTVKELVNSYIPFSNNGNFIEGKFIRKICDKKGKVIYENKQQKKQVMSPETAYLMTQMLISGVQKGTSSRLNVLPFEIAGKTGTVGIKGTNYNSDVWSVAYTPQKTAGIWLGNSTGDKEFMLEGSNNGGTYCTNILRNTIKNIDIDKNKVFERPKGVIECKIDTNKLEKEHIIMLANPETPERYTKTALFNKKFAPTLIAEKYTKEKLCVLCGKVEKDYIALEFDAIKNATYKLYRIEEDQTKLLETFENICGKQTYVDKNICKDTVYTYFVEVLQDGEKTIKSNDIKLCAKGKNNEIKRIINFW